MRQKLISYDEFFMQNGACGDIAATDVFCYIERNSYVCLSAPHATQSYARKQPKCCDLFTGCLTKCIAEEKGYSCIWRQKYVERKTLVNDFIAENHLEHHFFLDIHAMRSGYDFDLAVGTGNFLPQDYAKVMEYIKILGHKYGIRYVVNHENYTGKVGLTGRIQQATGKAIALQLEWTKEYRDIYNSYDCVSTKTIPFIGELAEFIEDKKINCADNYLPKS